MGVCEVPGRLNRRFHNDCEKSPLESPGLNVVANGSLTELDLADSDFGDAGAAATSPTPCASAAP